MSLDPCWICTNPANSREHLVKKSDLKMRFGDVSQKHPIFLNKDKRRRPIGSLNAASLKHEIPICEYCNTARTQPYDKAWEEFSRYVFENHKRLAQLGKIRCNKVFSHDTSRRMLAVYLYALKSFGMFLVAAEKEYKGLISLSELSDSLLNQKPHKNIYLLFGFFDGENADRAGVGGSDVHAQIDQKTGASVSVTWLYHVGRFYVAVIYAPEVQMVSCPDRWWHPKMGSHWLQLDREDMALKRLSA